MKKLLPLIVILAIVASCNPDEKKTSVELVIPHLAEPDLSGRVDNSGIAVTGDASDVSSSKAKLSAYANIPADADTAIFGIIYTEELPLSIMASKMIDASETDGDNMYVIPVSGLRPSTEYHYASYVFIGSHYHFGAIKSFTTTEYTLPGGAVDLGLSVKWGAANLGADSVEDYGDYFAWGEIEPHYYSRNPMIWREGKESGYFNDCYAWLDSSTDEYTKYCSRGDYGPVDDKTVLDMEDDAAYALLGEKWRMPTPDEWWELINNCSRTWTSENGVNGLLLTGPNNNSIFLPYTGYYSGTTLCDSGHWGDWWISSLDASQPCYAQAGNLTGDYDYIGETRFQRCDGLAIRPVMEY